MTAHDYFERLVANERELARASDHLDQLEAKMEQLSGATVVPARDNLEASWKIANLLDRLTDATKRWLDALEEWTARQDEAMRVIRSIEHENPRTAAFWGDCLYWRYMRDYTTAQVAEVTQHSTRAVEYAIGCALAAVDAQGLVVDL